MTEATTKTTEQLTDEICTMISETLCLDIVQPTYLLKDLFADSLDIAQMIMTIEAAYGIDINEHEIMDKCGETSTVAALVEFVENLIIEKKHANEFIMQKLEEEKAKQSEGTTTSTTSAGE